MSRIAYVNGRYVPHAEACVHVEDRGYQFSDGVYEVCEVFGGKLVDTRRHLDRLERSLRELKIAMPMTRKALEHVMREIRRRNKVRDGIVYVQVSRGVAPRDHVFPSGDVPPAVVLTARSARRELGEKTAEQGVKVITMPDIRWERVDIKSVSLLPNVLARQNAKEQGAKEAWFVDGDGNITEGGATNAWIVDKQGTLITRPAESGILRGITRTVVMDLAARENMAVEERAFSLQEAKEAREAFITAATTIVMPVVQIDDTVIGNGKPGSIATGLRALFHSAAEIDA